MGKKSPATLMGRDRVAPMRAVESMIKGTPLPSQRSGSGGGGSKGDNRGGMERALAKMNQIASGKSGQTRTMRDSPETMRRNRGK